MLFRSGPLDRADGVDVKIAGFAEETGGEGREKVVRSHPANIGNVAAMFRRLSRPKLVMRGLDPRIHLNERILFSRWIAGSSPAMTS